MATLNITHIHISCISIALVKFHLNVILHSVVVILYDIYLVLNVSGVCILKL
jgi:adenine deaminase